MINRAAREARSRRYYAAHRDEILARGRIYQAKNKEARLAQGRVYGAKRRAAGLQAPPWTVETRRNYLWMRRLARHGLTQYEHEVLYLTQSSCPVCGRQFEDAGTAGRAPALHHLHDSGVVVGIWCNRCNTGSGFYGDQPETLRIAADLNEVARAVKKKAMKVAA